MKHDPNVMVSCCGLRPVLWQFVVRSVFVRRLHWLRCGIA